MRDLGLQLCQPRPKRRSLTQAAHGHVPDLVGRDFTTDAPGKKLVGDITYVPTGEVWLYLAAVFARYMNADTITIDFIRRWGTSHLGKFTSGSKKCDPPYELISHNPLRKKRGPSPRASSRKPHSKPSSKADLGYRRTRSWESL